MFVLFLAVLSVFAAAKVDDDCVVCSFIVEQLQKEIDTEREAVKIGAKKWQKYEKSELRTIEILENLCKYAKDYKFDKKENRYVRFRESKATSEEEDAKFNPLKKSSKLKTQCDGIVEANEDELTKIIKTTFSPSPPVDVLKRQFCVASKLCPASSNNNAEL